MIQLHQPLFDSNGLHSHDLGVLQKTERMLFHVFQEVEYYTDH